MRSIWFRWLRWCGLALVALVAAGPTVGSELADLRVSFPRIEPYRGGPTAPLAREFSIPGPGTLTVNVTMAPWYRVGDPLRFRSLVPVDGRDEAAWASHVPGADRVASTSTPERWVDGGDLNIVTRYRVNKARPRLEVGLFPSAVRFGDGSMLQLANSVQVTITWLPDAPAAGAAPAQAGSNGAAVGPVPGTCEARAGSKVWPCRFSLVRRGSDGSFEGLIEWLSLGSVHRVRGTLAGSQMRFSEVEVVRPGGAHIGVDYSMTVSGGAADGTWVDRSDGSTGQMRLPWPER